MKLKVVKDNIDDPSFVEASDLVKGFITEHQDISHLATKEDVNAIIEGLASLSILLHKGTFLLAAPINLASNPSIETTEQSEGTAYWDIVNKRFRIKTDKGWETK